MKKSNDFVILISFFLLILTGCRVVDKSLNQVHLEAPYTVSREAKELYNSLEFVSDLHCDALLWKRNLLKRNKAGSVDVPRMLEARMDLQAFTIVSKVPFVLKAKFEGNSSRTDMITALFMLQGRNPNTWNNLTNRAIAQCRTLQKVEEKSKGAFRIIRSSNDLERYMHDKVNNPNITSGLLGIEGLQVLQGDIKNVDVMYDNGVRMMAPVHFFDNELGGSAHGIERKGITPFGRDVIKRLEEKKIIVDVAHASPELLDDILSISTRPVVNSHTGVMGTQPSPRNLTDEQLMAIAQTGGLIGIAFFEEAVGGTDAASTARAIHYTVRLVGAEHVALGSDFDGSVSIHFDVTGLPLLVEEMLKLGMSEKEIRMVMGENVRRFLLENLPKE